MSDFKTKELKNTKTLASRINVSVTKIPYEGLKVKESCDAAVLDLSLEHIKIERPIEIVADFHKVGDTVTVDLKICAFAKMVCGRCLEEFEKKLETRSQLDYTIEPNEHNLDITDEIREELILEYPASLLCNSNCKGLCSKCGKNLNEETCNCK